MSMEFQPVQSMPADELEPASLLDMPLRVCAEIGRARMPAAFVVGMPQGAIIDLDCEPDEPADLFVNGRHFGTGRLVLVDGEWGLRVETLDEQRGVEPEQLSSDEPAAGESPQDLAGTAE
jgi:flagellar motor switch protein FliN/FliY